MSWVTIVWSMVASACLTLAAMHLLVWCKQRTAWANLLFSLTAVATAAMAYVELWMMRAETPGQFGTALRWLHVPAWVIIVALAGFVRIHLRAGRPGAGSGRESHRLTRRRHRCHRALAVGTGDLTAAQRIGPFFAREYAR